MAKRRHAADDSELLNVCSHASCPAHAVPVVRSNDGPSVIPGQSRTADNALTGQKKGGGM